MTDQQPPLNVPIEADRRDSRWGAAAVCLTLAAITFAVFGQTLRFDFVEVDDNEYVYENPMVSHGLSLRGIIWAFTHFHSYNWHPLTWISHMLDCQLYGLHPAGHHLTNVLLHTATVILLFLVLRQMTGALWRCAFVAAVFAIHPLRVESVAWVAERKDVLSALFFVLTIGAYVRYVRGPWSPARYGLVVFLFALGLLSKPMLVTLPLVLLLLDYWPLRRVDSALRLVVEKLPLLALSAASCVATLLAQTDAIQSTRMFSPAVRFVTAVLACKDYLVQMVYPAGLAVFYPFPRHGLSGKEALVSGVVLAVISLLAWLGRRTRPWLLMGWVWYLVMLVPVTGIVQVGTQAHADRYTYLPQIGVYLALTWLAADWAAKWRVNRVALGALMAGVVAAFMVCAWKQAGFWRNSEILWNHALACTTDNHVALFHLGNVFRSEGRTEEAIADYQKSLDINPFNPEVHNNLGTILFKKGDTNEAIAHMQTAVQLKPRNALLVYNLGVALQQVGRVDEAIACYRKTLSIDPENAAARHNLGKAFLQEQKAAEPGVH